MCVEIPPTPQPPVAVPTFTKIKITASEWKWMLSNRLTLDLVPRSTTPI